MALMRSIEALEGLSGKKGFSDKFITHHLSLSRNSWNILHYATLNSGTYVGHLLARGSNEGGTAGIGIAFESIASLSLTISSPSILVAMANNLKRIV